MEPNDRFRKAEDAYFSLRGRLEAGRITRAQFDAALKELMVQDDQGRRWALGASDGKWYRYDGRVWAPADPYAAPDIPPGPAPLPQSPATLPRPAGLPERAATKGAPPPAQGPAPAKPRRRGCGRALLILLLLLAAGALVYWGWPRVGSLLPGLRKGDCGQLAAVVRSESATGKRLTCAFGLADEVTIELAPSREAALQRIAAYSTAQQQAAQSLAGAEGFVDRSRWEPGAAIYDVQASVAGQPLFTRAGLLLYGNRTLVEVRLANWGDDASMQARWNEILGSAKELIDRKLKGEKP